VLIVANPAPDLAPQIETLWAATSEGKSGTTFYEHFPAGNVDLIFRFSASGCRMVLLGPAAEKACVEVHEASEYFGMRFRIGQAPRLADVKPSDLINGRVELTKLGGERIDSLSDRFLSSPRQDSRRLVMENLLRGSGPLVRDERCRKAAMVLEAYCGRLQVKELAVGLGIHVRSLERLFLEHLGMSPKRLIRLARLKRLVIKLRSGDFGSFADLAYSCGYSDQSHMIRDFKELTGRVPGEMDSTHTGKVQGAPQTRIVHRYRP
jgi:AraC-like DNA-binding protein